MRKIIILLFFYFLPFIAVWTAWICTACAFDVQNVFTKSTFWSISLAYYFCLVYMTGIIAEAINETN